MTCHCWTCGQPVITGYCSGIVLTINFNPDPEGDYLPQQDGTHIWHRTTQERRQGIHGHSIHPCHQLAHTS